MQNYSGSENMGLDDAPQLAPPRGFVIAFGGEPLPEGQPFDPSPTFHQPDPVPVTAVEAGGLRVWCYGELASYGADGETQDCLRRALADWRADRCACDQLNGRFLLLIRDEAARAWHVVTDRMGAMHAYQVRRGGRVAAIGSDLATVAHQFSRRELDWEALTSFFTLGFFLDDRTHFLDVRALLPGSVYTFSDAGRQLDQRRTWEWHHSVAEARSYDESLDTYDTLLRKAVTRRTTPGQPILPLSGGLDSRSLALALPEGAAVPAYSYGYTGNSDETRLAAQVARARGLPFTAHVIPPYLFGRLAEIAHTLHGGQDVTMARQMSVNAWVRQRADAVLTGLWGDVWCDQMGLADGLPGGQTLAGLAFKKMAKRGHGWLVENVCAAHLSRGEVADFLVEWIDAGLRVFDHIADLDFRLKAYKTAQWGFRWSNASLRGFDPGGMARVPYYDTDLIDFFCSVPTAFVRGRRLQIDHLKRRAPELARIRWQQAEANLHLAPFGYWVSLPRRAVRKAYRLATRQRAVERNWEVQFLSPGGREGLGRWLLRPGLALHDFVSQQAVRDLLDGFAARPDAANGYAVSMLLTFSAWLEIMR